MNEVDFNLLDEPWIIVANAQGQEETLTLTETLVRSHELASISGEMTAQDISITRLLLGVLYTIYTRTDEYKEAQDYNNGDMCTEIWKNMWKRGHFPENEITEYLEAYRDRFWLIHPGRPFYQVASLETLDKSHFITSKMIGDIVESANKTPLFSSRTGRGKQKLLYPEAARWLIHLNSFDDAALKKTKLDYDHDSNSWKATTRDFESIGPGWLGQLGLVYAMGNNLFETLMLNFTLRQSSQEPWESGKAAWELETPRSSERTSIVMPTSGEELFTLQSRRIYLKRVDGVVVGFVIIGGDHFSKEDAFNEPMTMWRLKKDKQKDSYFPKTEQSTSKQFWRDFAPLMAKTDGSRKPGILKWLDTLRSKRAIPSRHVRICTLNVIYGSQSSGVKEVWSDAISINTTVLSELGDNWQVCISELLKLTDSLVGCLGALVADIELSKGIDEGDKKKNYYKVVNEAKEDAYMQLDIPFRTWLTSINAESDDINDTMKHWVSLAKTTLLNTGKELVEQAGPQAFKGNIKIAAPEAYRKFNNSISKCLREANFA